MAKRSVYDIDKDLKYAIDNLEKRLVEYREFRAKKPKYGIAPDPSFGPLLPISPVLYAQLTARVLQLEALVELTTPRQTVHLHGDILTYIFSHIMKPTPRMRLVCQEWRLCASMYITHFHAPIQPLGQLFQFLTNPRQLFTRVESLRLGHGNVEILPYISQFVNSRTVVEFTSGLISIINVKCNLNGAALHLYCNIVNNVKFENARYITYFSYQLLNEDMLIGSHRRLLANIQHCDRMFCKYLKVSFKWDCIMLCGDSMPHLMELIQFTADKVSMVYLGHAATRWFNNSKAFRSYFDPDVNVKPFTENPHERIAIFGE